MTMNAYYYDYRLRKSVLLGKRGYTYSTTSSQPDIPMPRVWKSAAGPNWTDYPPLYPDTLHWI